MRLASSLLALVVIGATSVQAQQPPSILFIGNSFTFGSGSAARYWRANTVTDLNHEGIGGVPAIFKSFADQMGIPYDVYLETRGGSGYEFHLAEKRAELSSRPWNIVVMHGQSLLDLDTPRDTTKFMATSQEMIGFLRGVSPQVQIYMTATWSRADEIYPEDGAWHGTPVDVMARDVRAAYDVVASRNRGLKPVSPVGEAWNRAFATGIADPNPYDGIDAGKVNLWTYDSYHASEEGYYLEALVVFGNVTGVDPRALGRGECSALELGISAAQAESLQQVAYDQLTASGITTHMPAGREPPTRAARCSASEAMSRAVDVTGAAIDAFIDALPKDRISDLPIRIADVGGYKVGVYGVFRPRSQPGGAIRHQTSVTEIYYMLEGAGTLVTDGTVTAERSTGNSPNTGRPNFGGDGIAGGVARRMVPGDVVIIPGNVPHWWSELESDIRYLILRPDPEGLQPVR